MFRCLRPAVIVAGALLVLSGASARASTWDGRPKILLHVRSVTTKNICNAGLLSDCQSAVTGGQVASPGSGPYYFAYLLEAGGANAPTAGIAGVELGIQYQNGLPGDMDDGEGIDIFSWHLCATLEFQTPTPGWPRPGSGNLITWDSVNRCQTGDTGVAGYFYLACYSSDDLLQITPRPVSGFAKVANCASIEQVLLPSDLGQADFSLSGTTSGCNPCREACPDPLGVDNIPPDAITLSLVNPTTPWSITVSWPAPLDRGGSMTSVATYDLRYSTAPITEANFTAAPSFTGVPTPRSPGTLQSCQVWMLTPLTTYYLAIRSVDYVGNWSAISNVVSARTIEADTLDPAAVTDLAVTSVTPTTLTVGWTAPGDDGTTGRASLYDFRVSLIPITESNFRLQSENYAPTPAWAGTRQTLLIANRLPDHTYYVAMKTMDEQENWSAISNVVSATTPLADTTPPAAVQNLTLAWLTDASATLTWSAPGDDSLGGTAAQYDVRYSEIPITPASFASASSTTGEPAPATPGTLQSFTVTGLAVSHTYYFALKTADEVPNWSGLSNVVSGSTGPPAAPDTLAPAAITDLAVTSVGAGSMTLDWTAPGDDGNTGRATAYDLRFSTAAITPANFALMSQAATPTPSLAGTRQGLTLSNLVSGSTYYFAIKARDEASNWSGLSNLPSQKLPLDSSNNYAKIMLHLTSPRSGNACAPLGISNCTQFVTAGDLAAPGIGPFYYAYLLPTEFGSLAGLECGITYDGGNSGGMNDGARIDILSWTRCATLEFPSSSPEWPRPGSGNVLTWDALNQCQTGFTAVAGWFYLAAYGPDELRVTPRPASQMAKVANCVSRETVLPLNYFGSIAFSDGATAHGENPCGRSQSVPVRHVTWSTIKTLLGP